MAKKQPTVTGTDTDTVYEDSFAGDVVQMENETQTGEVDLLGNTELTDEDDYKALPLVPNGLYEGEIKKVSYDNEAKSITWSVELSENDDALCVDEETPVHGAYVYYRNWLPKLGDDKVMTKSGRQTKKQAKLNMLGDFAKAMQFPGESVRDHLKYISDGINDEGFVGQMVQVKVSISSYEGRLRNQCDSMAARD